MIRTVEQYMESLNDGREIWCLGEKVKDVRTHPILRTIVMASATDFVSTPPAAVQGPVCYQG